MSFLMSSCILFILTHPPSISSIDNSHREISMHTSTHTLSFFFFPTLSVKYLLTSYTIIFTSIDLPSHLPCFLYSTMISFSPPRVGSSDRSLKRFLSLSLIHPSIHLIWEIYYDNPSRQRPRKIKMKRRETERRRERKRDRNCSCKK